MKKILQIMPEENIIKTIENFNNNEKIKIGTIILHNKNIDNLLCWEGNRPIDRERVDDFYKKLEDGVFDFMLEPIHIAHNKQTGENFIVGGQHRISAIKRYIKEKNTTHNIYVQFHIENDEEEISELYMKLNYYKPHHDSERSGNTEIKNTVDDIIKFLIDKHKGTVFQEVQSTKRVNRPAVNLNKLNSELTELLKDDKTILNNFKILYIKFLKKNIGKQITEKSDHLEYKILRENMCAFSCVKASNYKFLIKDILKKKVF